VDARCRDCNGRGVQVITRQMGNFIQQMQAPCSNCKGKGSSLKPEDRCKKCNGEQILKEKKIFEVNIEKGMKKGDFVAFRGDGDQVPGVRLSGDIIIVLDQKHHALFTRKGDHLYMEQTISLAQALTGFTLNVTHLDGRTLSIRPPHNTCVDPDHLWSISREGMPVAKTGGSERGMLVIKFKVQFPQTLSDDDSRELRKVLGVPPNPASPPDAEEVYLSKTQIDLNAEQSRHAQNEDEDDEPRARGGGRTTQCAAQ
jgi:DnaJ family protein A protein 2